jgi:tyrosine-protein kinase Etk/Wzc
VSLALLDRKTILLDFDFRKPKLHEYLDMGNLPGATSYLINKTHPDDIIVSTGIKNLDFIAAGPIPPNPVELIGSEKTEQLINHLKTKYDYIIIDTPPCGQVSEALLLMKYSDLKIFVVRLNHTPKKQLTTLLDEMEEKKIDNLCLLLNDIPIKKNNY